LFIRAIEKESAAKSKKAPVTTHVAAAASPDGHAKGLLGNARNLAKAGLYAAAEKKFRQVLDEAPGTPAAADAQKELDGLPPH